MFSPPQIFTAVHGFDGPAQNTSLAGSPDGNRRRTQIQTPRRNMRLAHRRLMPSNPQPCQFVTFLLQCLPFRSTLAKSPSQSITRGVLSMSLTRRALIKRMAQIGGYSAAFATMQALGLVPTAEASLLPQLPADFGKGKKSSSSARASPVSSPHTSSAKQVSTAPSSKLAIVPAAAHGPYATAVKSSSPTAPSKPAAGKTADTSTPAPRAFHPFTQIS
jgi:hypothetical protein